ncbi:MAG: DUF1573 domain-containing protein [Bacteroidota bacterium]|jgi:hypothetical protein|nr:DUF1573 domain-containing protein [Bacteroidota bacterium]
MRRSSILLVLLVQLVSVVSAQGLRVDAEEKAFAPMRPLERRSLTFTLFNDATDTLHLGAPRPSCGCTATMLDRDVLAPGDSAHVSVAFHAAPGMNGTVAKSVSIYGIFGTEERRLSVLRVRAVIETDLVCEPPVLRFETVIGDTVRLTLLLRSNSEQAVRIGRPSAAITAYVDTSAGNTYHVERIQARPFSAVTIEPEHEAVEPGETSRLLITLVPTEKGQINGSIQIPLPNTMLRIPVIGAVLRQRE